MVRAEVIAMEVVLFMVGTLVFLGGLGFCLMRVFTAGAGEEAAVSLVDVSERAAIAAATFRVVNARGVCPAGLRTGDLVSIDAAGSVAPELCPPAEAVLRLAAQTNGRKEGEEWCCPIFEHQLAFEREPAVQRQSEAA